MASVNAAAIDLSDRFTKPVKTYINDLEQLLRNYVAANPPLHEPCIKSKLFAALEFILVTNRINNQYELLDDNGWPVSRIYDGVPKLFAINRYQFQVTLFKDSESLYILFHFGRISYRLIECSTNWVPCFNGDTESDIERFDSIKKRIFKQLFDEIKDGPLFKVSMNEQSLIERSTSYPGVRKCQQLQEVNHRPCFVVAFNKECNSDQTGLVNPCLFYRKIQDMSPNRNHLDELNHLNRLYRSIVQALNNRSCTNPENKNLPIQLIEEYVGELISICYQKVKFYISILEANDEFFIIMRDFKRTFLHGYKIPVLVVPTFKEDSMSMFLDNYRLVDINQFMRWIVLESLEQVCPDSRPSFPNVIRSISPNPELEAYIAAQGTE